MTDPQNFLTRLKQSKFRARFHLDTQSRVYLRQHGLPTIMAHAEHFITTRLTPANPKNDGKQTPMRGHPVFIAQHATATCCRTCLEKWHGYKKHTTLTETQQAQILTVIQTWITHDSPEDAHYTPDQKTLF